MPFCVWASIQSFSSQHLSTLATKESLRDLMILITLWTQGRILALMDLIYWLEINAFINYAILWCSFLHLVHELPSLHAWYIKHTSNISNKTVIFVFLKGKNVVTPDKRVKFNHPRTNQWVGNPLDLLLVSFNRLEVLPRINEV